MNFAAKLRQCRDTNRLNSSNNYEKDYIIDYGYKYDKNGSKLDEVYQLTPMWGRDEKNPEKIMEQHTKGKKIQLPIRKYVQSKKDKKMILASQAEKGSSFSRSNASMPKL